MKKAEEGFCRFIEPGEDAPEVLHFTEKALDKMALAIPVFIIIPWFCSVFARWNHRRSLLFLNVLDGCVAVIPLVGNDPGAPMVSQKGFSLGDFMPLAP